MKKVEELKEVNGGGHLDMDEVKALNSGQILVIEQDTRTTVIGKCMYLGEHGDYKVFKREALKVKILEIYDQEYLNSVAARLDEKDNIPDSSHKNNPIRVGEEVLVSRWNLDFPK